MAKLLRKTVPRPPSHRAVSEVLAAKAAWNGFRFLDATRRIWTPARRVDDAVARADDNMHAIGIGFKVVKGKPTRTLSVRMYVTRKLPRSLVPAKARLPANLDGVPTDVIEAPPAYLAAAALPPPCSIRRTRLQRPVCPGISASNAAVNAGTISMICRSRLPADAGKLFVLGNNHTLADLGAAQLGSAIVQPSPADGGDATGRIATLARFVPIDDRPTATNEVDVALAELVAGVASTAGICSIGIPQGTADPVFGTVVLKHGRTTGLTRGIIDDPSVDALVPLSRHNPGRMARFVKQIRIVPSAGMSLFAQPGDSGALVTTSPGNRVVGLLFACPDNGQFAYANPITSVIDALDIAI
jgi:hypothetical protein